MPPRRYRRVLVVPWEGPVVSQHALKAVTPPPDSEYYWKNLMNHIYGCGEDRLFEWLRDVRVYIEEQEKKRRRVA